MPQLLAYNIQQKQKAKKPKTVTTSYASLAIKDLLPALLT